MTVLFIEKGIEIPKPIKKKSAVWWHMDIGDSVLIQNIQRGNANSYWTRVSKETGRKFISRTVEGGVRVWRTE